MNPVKTGRQDAIIDKLGPLVCTCHYRTWRDQQLAYGCPRWQIYLVPVSCACAGSAGALLLVMLVFWLANIPPVVVQAWHLWLVTGLSAVLSYAVISVIILKRPRRSLAVHSYGIRYKRNPFPFDDIHAVRIGRTPHGHEGRMLAVSRLLGKLSHTQQALVDAVDFMNCRTWSLVLKNGREYGLGPLDIICEPYDFQRFVSAIQKRQPRLLTELLSRNVQRD